MCTRSEPAAPSSPAQALAMVSAGLGYLSGCDAAGLGTAVQAEALIGLEQAEAQHTAARARILSAFTADQGFQADGQFGVKAWLRAVTMITRGAAAGATGWARRLAAHPVLAGALAAAQLSASWARQFCDWTDTLPEDHRADADQILLAAALGGADLHDLGALAQEMAERARTGPDRDDGGFNDRALRADTTIGGAGRVSGDLTPACAAALTVVLDALSGTAGPEDTRTLLQRRHDALEEACQRLIAARMLPGRDGQPVHVQVHVDLATLRGLPGGPGGPGLEAGERPGPEAGERPGLEARREPRPGSRVEPGQAAGWSPGQAAGWSPGQAAGWSPARAAADPGSVYLSGAGAEAAACDATVTPVVTGRLDWTALDQLTTLFAQAHGRGPDHHRDQPPVPGRGRDNGRDRDGRGRDGRDRDAQAEPAGISPALRLRLRDTLLDMSITLLSGPGGLASCLRAAALGEPYNSLSQPLDMGAPTPEVPPHLRKAVIARDQHCQFPGCAQPPSVCQVHHLTPRSKGGPTALRNLRLLCRFHHLIVIHRWGWKLTCHPDGTTTATSPDGRALHSHGPPSRVA